MIVIKENDGQGWGILWLCLWRACGNHNYYGDAYAKNGAYGTYGAYGNHDVYVYLVLLTALVLYCLDKISILYVLYAKNKKVAENLPYPLSLLYSYNTKKQYFQKSLIKCLTKYLFFDNIYTDR